MCVSGAGAGMRWGVSISRYPWSTKKRRMAWMILALIQSALRRLIRAQFLSTVYSLTRVEYSPVRVSIVINSPSWTKGGMRRT